MVHVPVERRKAAEAGFALALNLSIMYATGESVEQNTNEAVNWLQLAAEQVRTLALKGLADMQQHNVIPTPPPGTAVTTILLTSAKAIKDNSMAGKVAIAREAASIKLVRAAVLLDGEGAPIALKLMA